MGEEIHFDSIRSAFYALFPGNWHSNIADLGDIDPGESVEDSYFALRTAVEVLVEKKIIWRARFGIFVFANCNFFLLNYSLSVSISFSNFVLHIQFQGKYLAYLT